MWPKNFTSFFIIFIIVLTYFYNVHGYGKIPSYFSRRVGTHIVKEDINYKQIFQQMLKQLKKSLGPQSDNYAIVLVGIIPKKETPFKLPAFLPNEVQETKPKSVQARQPQEAKMFDTSMKNLDKVYANDPNIPSGKVDTVPDELMDGIPHVLWAPEMIDAEEAPEYSGFYKPMTGTDSRRSLLRR